MTSRLAAGSIGPEFPVLAQKGIPPMRVIVVGAGIGGLAAAIALRRRGIAVSVIERSADPGEIGAGITLWPNAMRALRSLGVADEVAAAGAPVLLGDVRSWRGGVLSPAPFPDLERRFGEPGIALHRADLHRLLLAALAPDAPRLGARCVGFEEAGEAVTVHLADGGRERADLLVGADGLRSTVRAQLWGEAPPRYAGYTAWRAVVAAAERGTFESWGRGHRFGLVPIGRGRVYWFATANAAEGGADAADLRSELLRRFGDWHRPIPAVIAATPAAAILRHDIFDRPPLPRWSRGRVTLLGDAAHPMTPNLGQGACQAIEDALVLAACLDGTAAPAALAAYDALRVPRTSALVDQSRTLGRVGQLGAAPLVRLRDAAVKRLPPRTIARRLEPIFAGVAGVPGQSHLSRRGS